MRHITSAGLDLIKQFEGFKDTIYLDLVGVPTIGYGCTRQPLPETVTVEEAEEMLRVELLTAERGVLRLIKVPLTDGQFDALVSWTFNLGTGALQRSTLRMLVNREEHGDVPEQFLRWCRAGGVVVRGLVRRRQAEAEMYES